MDFGHLFNQTLGPMGFNITGKFNGFTGSYNYDTGWDLNLPPVDFENSNLHLLHFPDFVTIKDGRVLELEKVEQHYGEHANRVLVTYWTSDLEQVYSGPINLIKFSNHNYDMCNALAEGFDQWKHILTTDKTHAWQCLNGRLCLHRRRVVDVLEKWDHGWLSYGTDIPLPVHNYQCLFGCENFPNFLALDYVYGSAPVNIVTETQYDPPTGIITEKTILALAAEQIPIIIGHRGIVDQCRRMGFDMFDDLVDNSYDQLPNESRAEAALELNRDLIQGKIDLTPYRDRLIRQREYLLYDLPDKMEREFVAHARALADRLIPGYTP